MATKKEPTAEANGTSVAAPGVLTLAEAAAFLRVSDEGLRSDAESGRIPARKVAGQWRFVKATLLQWLSQPDGGLVSKSMLSVAGVFKGDETLMPMVEEIYRERERRAVGGRTE